MSLSQADDRLPLDTPLEGLRAPERAAPEVVSPFRLFEVLWRPRLTFLVVALAVLLVAVPRIAGLPSRYEASAMVLVDTRQNKLSDLQAFVNGTQSDVIAVRTQVDILRSPALAERVVTRLDLMHDPEFAPALNARPSGFQALLNDALSLVGLGTPPRGPYSEDEKIRLVTLSLINDKMAINNDGRSYVIGIAVRTDRPELSARIANTYARTYLDFNRELKDRAVTQANAWLDERLAPLQRKVRTAERAVEEFRARNGLADDKTPGADGAPRGTMVAQQLAQVNAQLVVVTAERVQREAAVEMVRRADGDLSAIPAVVASPLIQHLRGQESDLSSKIASLSLNQSTASPVLLGVQAELTAIRARIALEAQKIVGAIDSEAAAARAREAALKTALATLQQKMADQNRAEIRLRELESEAAARTVYTDYLNRAERTSNERDIQQPDADLISLANVPFTPAPPTKKQFLILAAIAAAIAGGIAALVRERMEPGFRTAEQAEAETGLPTLGLVPRVGRRKRALDLDARETAFVEAVSHVRGVLQIAGGAAGPRVILVTSAVPQEGKTFFAVALGRSIALTGARCLLVDCDLRRPSVATVLGVEAEPGLGPESLAVPGQGLMTPSSAIDRLVRRDAASQLDIITAADAPTDASVLVASERLRTILAEARTRYDFVILDAPPALAFVDARVLSRIADSTVLVVRWRHTPRRLVSAAIKALRFYGARIAGAVLTQVDLGAADAADSSQGYVLRRYGTYVR